MFCVFLLLKRCGWRSWEASLAVILEGEVSLPLCVCVRARKMESFLLRCIFHVCFSSLLPSKWAPPTGNRLRSWTLCSLVFDWQDRFLSIRSERFQSFSKATDWHQSSYSPALFRANHTSVSGPWIDMNRVYNQAWSTLCHSELWTPCGLKKHPCIFHSAEWPLLFDIFPYVAAKFSRIERLCE